MSDSGIPWWQALLVALGIIFLGALALTVVGVGGQYLIDKYSPNTYIDVEAGYQNTTTICVEFDEFTMIHDPDHFNFTKTLISNVEIILDGNQIASISGDELNSQYTYPVSPERHELLVIVNAKNGKTYQHRFSNANLERG